MIDMMHLWRRLLIGMFLAPLLVRAGGDEVVVIYNSRVPESKQVAEHYAALRQVPANQIFGFALGRVKHCDASPNGFFGGVA